MGTIYAIQDTFSIPAPVSSLTLGHVGQLYAGSDDGSLRVYDLSTNKVSKAIRGLSGEVSSIICVKRPGSELRDAWVAHGRMISRFKLDTKKMIQTLDDALVSLTVGETEDDLVNQLALNGNKSHLAFGLDSGVVGLVELGKKEVKKLQQKHTAICSSVQFISDRGNELVSAGYDHFVKHLDFIKDEFISGIQMDDSTLAAPGNGISFSPPFVLSTAVSPSGVFAIGTADGRLGVFFGGERSTVPSKKKPKKWPGLSTAEMLLLKVADGPIVALSFSQARVLTISTMLGVLTQYELIYDAQDDEGQALLKRLWQGDVKTIGKVNTMLVDERRIIIGGLSKDGKGVIEVWKKGGASIAAAPEAPSPEEQTPAKEEGEN